MLRDRSEDNDASIFETDLASLPVRVPKGQADFT
jgi:hypothetical protein